jgi:hypothetical protein
LRIGQNVLLASRSRAFLWGVRSAFARIEESGGAGSLRNAGHRAPQVYVSALHWLRSIATDHSRPTAAKASVHDSSRIDKMSAAGRRAIIRQLLDRAEPFAAVSGIDRLRAPRFINTVDIHRQADFA